MTNPTTKGARGKPGKPHPLFPLFAHDNGRWAKKIRQRLVYFGKWVDDPKGEAALELFKAYMEGRDPRKSEKKGATIADLCNAFLTSKMLLVESGELTERTFRDYSTTTDLIVAAFGKARIVSELRPDDFERLRAKLARRLGPVGLGNTIGRIRVVFNFGYKADLIDRPVKVGPQFKRPSKRVLRLARQENGLRMFEAAELRRLIAAADTQLKAMILLGVNCGLGASDVGQLPKTALDLSGGWLNYARPKTGVNRRVPLWPETVKALRVVLGERREPREAAHRGLVFLTAQGRPWWRVTPLVKDEKGRVDGGVPIDPIGQRFTQLLKNEGLKRERLGFYALRHTTETVGDEANDRTALSAIMGHIDNSMAGTYRERISDDRLRAVVDHVRRWLFPPKKPK